jgi:hypothetical protein
VPQRRAFQQQHSYFGCSECIKQFVYADFASVGCTPVARSQRNKNSPGVIRDRSTLRKESVNNQRRQQGSHAVIFCLLREQCPPPIAVTPRIEKPVNRF